MKKVIRSTAILFSMAFAAQAAIYTPPPGDLIVNGSFENRFTGWSGTVGLYNSANPVSGTNVGYVVDVGGVSGHQCMSQTIATTPGTTYQIDFSIRLPELFQIGGYWVP